MAYAYIYEFNNTAIQLVSVHYALRHCHRFLTASWLSNSGPLFRLHCACDPLTLLLHLTLTVTPEAAGLPQCCFSALTWAPLLWCSSQLCSSRWWLSQWHWFCLRWEKHTCFYFFFFFVSPWFHWDRWNEWTKKEEMNQNTGYQGFFPPSRYTICIVAEAEAWSVHRTSGALECGRAPRCVKQASMSSPSRPRVRACPSTPPQCRTTLTTVTGDGLESPLGGDR